MDHLLGLGDLALLHFIFPDFLIWRSVTGPCCEIFFILCFFYLYPETFKNSLFLAFLYLLWYLNIFLCLILLHRSLWILSLHIEWELGCLIISTEASLEIPIASHIIYPSVLIIFTVFYNILLLKDKMHHSFLPWKIIFILYDSIAYLFLI
jgi:hypothetical protein